MRRHRLKRKLFWAGIVLALLLIYLASAVVRVGVLARDLVMRKAPPRGPFALTGPGASLRTPRVELLLPWGHGTASCRPREMSFSFLLRVFRGRQVSNP